ncbi:MAG: zinc-binding dehydrogenase [Candidatus Acidiferrales bacterium]
MKAMVFSEHGGPEVLRYTDVPEPSIGPNEVLVRVRACALNHLDLWIRRGLPGISVPLPHILGSDIAGEIASVGNDVDGIKTGEKVVLSPGIPCGNCEQCVAGRDSQCRQYTLFGYMVPGGYAEYVKAPAVNVVPMPQHLSYVEAAALPLVFVTAWHMLITRANLKPAEEVLVLGAGSGVGSAAIQIAKVAGARVIATAGSDEKLAKAKDLGADDTILHSKHDIANEVKRLTNRRGVDVVFEHVGEATWEKSIRSLAVGGRLVTCGATTGFEGKIDIRYLFSRQISILGSYMGTKAELLSVMELVQRKAVKPVLDKVFPLTEAAEAHGRLEKGEQFGKIVLRIP